MAQALWVDPRIEVVLLSGAVANGSAETELSATSDSKTVESTDDSPSDRLLAGLREQGIEPAAVISIADSDPVRRRVRLADALAGSVVPSDSTGSRGTAVPLGPIAVLAADIVVNATPLGAVLDDPRIRTGVLALRVGNAMDPALADRRQFHLGVLRVDGPARPAAAAVLRAAAGKQDDLILELIQALTERGVEVRPVPLGGYAWARPNTAEQRIAAVAAVEELDERTVRLREAARGGDGFYSTFVLRRISWRFTGMAERIGLTPNQVTLISFALGLLAAGFLALGSRPWSVAGALLLQFCLVVDCVDGELARYRRRFSRFGAWLDATTDRVKEFAAIGALAVAAGRSGLELWGLVVAAIAIQTFRNLLDLGWARQRSMIGTDSRPGPEWVAAASWVRAPGPAPAGALNWARRVGHFPIGERFLLISLGAALFTPNVTLIALVLVGGLAASYLLAAFAVRSRPVPGRSGGRITELVDAGPVLAAVLRRAVGERAGRAAVLLPALVAVVEVGLVWWLAELAGARPSAAVALVAATAIAHYQQAYGVREAVAEGGFVIGTDLRVVALALIVVGSSLVLADADGWATSAVWALAALVVLSSTARSLKAWTAPADASLTEPGAGAAPAGATGPGTGSTGVGSSGPVGPDGLAGWKRQKESPIDRMQTGHAEPGPTLPRRAIGGIR